MTKRVAKTDLVDPNGGYWFRLTRGLVQQLALRCPPRSALMPRNTSGRCRRSASVGERKGLGNPMPTSSNVLCGCGRFMHVVKNGVTVEELLHDGVAYKLWDADLYQCADCHNQVITGFGRQPLAESWQPTYDAQYARLHPVYPGRGR